MTKITALISSLDMHAKLRYLRTMFVKRLVTTYLRAALNHQID